MEQATAELALMKIAPFAVIRLTNQGSTITPGT